MGQDHAASPGGGGGWGAGQRLGEGASRPKPGVGNSGWPGLHSVDGGSKPAPSSSDLCPGLLGAVAGSPKLHCLQPAAGHSKAISWNQRKQKARLEDRRHPARQAGPRLRAEAGTERGLVCRAPASVAGSLGFGWLT